MNDREPFSICILSSATSPGSDWQPVRDQLANDLHVSNFSVLTAFRPVTGLASASYQTRDVKLSYWDYFTSKEIANPRINVYVAFPNDMSLLHALSGILRRMDELNEAASVVILLPASYWKGFISWLEESALQRGEVNQHTLERIALVDTISEASTLIRKHAGEPGRTTGTVAK